MSFDVQIVQRVDQVDCEAWDHLSRGRSFASRRWYRFGEQVLGDDRPFYLLLSRHGEPLARAALWLRRRQPLPIASAVFRWLVGSMIRRRPLLLCQAPLADTSSLVLPPPPLRDEALRLIAQAARELARQQRVSFAGFVYLEEWEARCAGWPADWAAVELPEPGMRLSIASADWGAFLQSLSLKTRKQVRRHGNRAAELGVEVAWQPPGGALAEEALTLVRNVERRHGAAPNPWAQAILQHAGMVDATWLTARVAGRLVGCGLLLADDDDWMMTLLGRDYAVQYAYFQLVYTAVRRVVEGGGRVLWGGTGAYELKQQLGFCPTSDNYAVYCGNGRLLQYLGRRVAAAEESRVADAYPARGETVE